MPYEHHKTLLEFESVHRQEYEHELEDCDRWIKWCESQNPPDTHGMNFHQGKRSAHVFNNIKMEQLLRVLKQEEPNQNKIITRLYKVLNASSALMNSTREAGTWTDKSAPLEKQLCDAIKECKV